MRTRPRSTSPISPTTRAPCGPGRSSSACAGATRTGTRSRRPPPRAGAAALVVEQPLDVDAAAARRGGRARGDADRGGALLRRSVPRARRSPRVTGTNGKTTTAFLLHAILEAAGRQSGLLTNIERRVGGERRPTGPQHARGDRPPAAPPRDGRRRRPRVRDGGDLGGAGAGPARGDAVRGARVHEPDPGPPQLPRHDGGVLRGEARALRPGRARGRQRRRRVGAPARRRAARTRSPSTPTRTRSTGSSCSCAARFNRENAIGAALAARALGVDARRDQARDRVGRRACPAGSSRSTRGSRSRSIVDYAHTPDSLENVIRAARGLGDGPADRSCSAPAATATARKRPLMGRVVAELADRAILTSDNPRSEDPEAIAARGRRRRARRARASSSTAAPRSSSRSPEAGPGDVVVIAGRGAEPEQELADRQGAVRRPGRRPRGPAPGRGAPVIPLELDLIEPLGRLHGAAVGRRGDRRADRLAPDRGGRPLRRGRRRAPTSSRTRSPAAPRRRSSPTTTHAALAAIGGRRPRPLDARVSSGSPARPARRRRRTSSPRSARRTCGRSHRRATSTTSSACR